jgi:biopolymer transport protein ExbD
MRSKLRKSTRKVQENPQLEMTSMIDVVFQLLIFFIVSIKPEDVLAHLDISRPAPDSEQREEQIEEMIEVIIGHLHTGFSMNGRVMTLEEIETRMRQVASVDRSTPIIIKCSEESRHRRLVEFLDICAKYKLNNLSVFTM